MISWLRFFSLGSPSTYFIQLLGIDGRNQFAWLKIDDFPNIYIETSTFQENIKDNILEIKRSVDIHEYVTCKII